MAKEKLKLSLTEGSGHAEAQLTAEEAKTLSDTLIAQAKAADQVTDKKKEGRIVLELGDGLMVVSVVKAKIEKPEDDKT